jgi:hypothetical protein
MAPGNPLHLHVKSFGSDIRLCEISVILSWLFYRLSLVMPSGRVFGTLDGHIAVIRYLVGNCFCNRICTRSAWIGLV